MLRGTIVALAAWLVLAASLPSPAETLLETSEVLAANAEAAAQLPPTYQFTLTAAGNYRVSLTDLGVPAGDVAPLQSLQALVTRDLQVVAELKIEYPTLPNETQQPATQTFAGTPGTYRVHVLGAIASSEAGGLFSVEVTPSNGGAAVFEAADSIAIQSGPTPAQSVLQTTFTVADAGTYQLNLSDRGFPAPLIDIDGVLLNRSARPATVVPVTGVNFDVVNPGTTLELIVIATADAGLAGSYGVTVTGGPASALIYRSENAVGQLPPARTVDITAAGTHELTLADLEFPEALTSFCAAVLQNGAFIGSATGSAPASLSLVAGPAQLLVFASTATIGALSVSLSQGAQVSYADVHIVDASPDATTPAIYSFAPSQLVSAGNYALTVTDVRFPAQLPSLRTAVVQNAAVVHELEEAASELVTLQADAVRVLVAATPPAASGTTPGNGMLTLSLKSQPGNTTVLESTQGVGGLFTALPITLPAAGRYDVALRDFEFPERLRTSWLAVTRGTTVVGQVIGSSSIQNLQLEAGRHVLNFLGQPAQNAGYGTFGIKVADSVPPPTVTLTVSTASVTSGQGTTLQWSATNATSCTASGGWSGTRSVSGSESTGALISNTAFEIGCVGPGGRDDASVTVTVNAVAPKSGGGGHIDPLLLACLLTALIAVRAARRSRSTM